MLKLSKLSKVFLTTGILLAFSCATMSYDAWAYKTDAEVKAAKQKCEETLKTAKKECKNKSTKAERANCENTETKKYQECIKIISEDKVGSGQVTETTTTESHLTGITSNGGQATYSEKKTTTTSSDTNSTWEKASKEKIDAQNHYTQANKEYQKCLAKNKDNASACEDSRYKLTDAENRLNDAKESYNKAQKTASDAYYAQKIADEKAAKAEEKALKADQKVLNKAEKELKNCQKKQKKDPDHDCSAEIDAVNAAQAQVNSHNKAPKDTGDGGYSSDKSSAELKRELDGVNNELKQAQADCEKYSALTSSDGKAKAQEACAKAAQLEDKAKELNGAYDKARTDEGNNARAAYGGVEAASMRLKTATATYNSTEGQGERGVVDISQSRNADADYGGLNVSGATPGNFNFNYKNGADVLDTVTRRAALVIVGLKPIVYVFAGFGLIAFAWMAIFGKLSWKWFGNIAMGLFLVANMGRFIEFFVSDGGDYHYYIGDWKSATNGNKENQLANAFHDIYYVYGDTNYNAKGLRNYVDESEIEIKTQSDTFKPNARGFCQSTSASGWANFTSCLGDIVATAKKAADTVKQAKAAVDDVKDRISTVKDKISNIKDAIGNMKGGSLTDIVSNAGTILNNVNGVVSTTTGAVGSLTNAASNISNNVQDMGKSTDQQKELADRRAAGEATNAFDAMLKGQEYDSTTGGVEKVDDHYAGKSNVLTDIQNTANDIKQKSDDLNSKAQDGLQQAGAVTNIIDNTALGQYTFGLIGSDKSLNEQRQEKREREAQEAYAAEQAAQEEAYRNSNAGINATYREQSNTTNRLYSDMKTQENEVSRLQSQKKEADALVASSCADESSAMCKAAKAQQSSIEASLSNKQAQLESTKNEYASAKESLEASYQTALQSNIDEAQKSYDEAEKRANEACSANASSSECASARKSQMQAANQLVSYINERDNKTKESQYTTKEQTQKLIDDNPENQQKKKSEETLKYEQEQETIRLKTEASQANQAYERTMDTVNTLYTQLNAQKKEAEELETEAKIKQEVAKNACATDQSSAVCTTARTAAKAAKEASENKKNQIKQTESKYDTAKKNAEVAYDQAVQANINQAKRDYENAKQQIASSQEQVKEVEKKMDSAKEAADAAAKTYDTAKSEAMAAKEAYDNAVASGRSAEEVAKLKADYDNKLSEMTKSGKEYQEKSTAYANLQTQKEKAEKAYNDAYARANDAGDRLASYTNERDNKTNENRKTSSEEGDMQNIIDQFNRETTPTAIAQASKNNYIQYKNKSDAAEQKLDERKAVRDSAKQAYEEALRKARETGSESDRKYAERLKKNYELADAEVQNAQKEYNTAKKEVDGYEKTYINNAIAGEEYKQKVYQSYMKKASEDINTYEKQVTSGRKKVDDLATKYMKAKEAASKGGSTEVQIAAQLYMKYKEAKEAYDKANQNLALARQTYQNAQKGYQQSVAEQKRLEDMKKNR